MAKSICSVEDCDTTTRVRGMCHKHYQRWLKTGSTAGPTQHPGSLERECETCGNPFTVQKRSMKNRFYGRPCFNESLRGREITWAHKIGDAKRGIPLSEEHKQKLKDNHRGMTGRTHSPETREKLRQGMLKRLADGTHVLPEHKGQKPFLGKTHTPETRARMAESKMGEKNPLYGKTEDQHPNWMGDDVGYFGLHDWMTSRYGQPIGCEFCGTDDPAKRYEWANVSGEYRRDRDDFVRLCKKCHNDFDGVNAWQQASRSA